MKKVTIYSDGACSGNPGPGGYGTVLVYNGIEKELSEGFDNTTNNRININTLRTIGALSIYLVFLGKHGIICLI